MLSAMRPFNTYKILQYSITYPSEKEKIYVLAKDVFGQDRKVKTTIHELNNMETYIKSQSKTEQMINFIELDELVSTYPSDNEYGMLPLTKFNLYLSKYKSKVLLYLVYKEVLYDDKITRLL